MAASNRRPADHRSSEEERPLKRPRLLRDEATLKANPTNTLFPASTGVKRTRSQLFEDHLPDFPHIAADGKHFKQFLFLTHDVINFNMPLASMGAPSKAREILTFNPEDEIFNAIYVDFLNSSEKIDLDSLTLFVFNYLKQEKSADPGKKIIEFLEKWLQEHEKDADAFITTLQSNMKIPVIGLEYFIQEKICCCRHYSLLVAFLLFKLIQDNKLSGEVHHHRDDVDGLRKGAHAFVVFKTWMNKHEEIFILDPINSKRALELHSDRRLLIHLFGETAVTLINDRYGSAPKPVAYKKQ